MHLYLEVVDVFVLGLTCWTIMISVSVSRSIMTNNKSQGPWSLEEDIVCPNKTYPYWVDDLRKIGCYNFTMSCEPLREPASKVTEAQYDEKSRSEDNWLFKKDMHISRIAVAVLCGVIVPIIITYFSAKVCAAAKRYVRKEWCVGWNGVAEWKKIKKMIEEKLMTLGNDADKDQLCEGVIQIVKNAVIERTKAGKKDAKGLCQVLCGKVPDAAKKIKDCTETSFAEWSVKFDADKTSTKPKARQMIEKLLYIIYASDKRRRFYFPSMKQNIEHYLSDFIPSRDQFREEQDPNDALRAPSDEGPDIIPGPSTSSSYPKYQQPEDDQIYIRPPTNPVTDEEGGALEFRYPINKRIDPEGSYRHTDTNDDQIALRMKEVSCPEIREKFKSFPADKPYASCGELAGRNRSPQLDDSQQQDVASTDHKSVHKSVESIAQPPQNNPQQATPGDVVIQMVNNQEQEGIGEVAGHNGSQAPAEARCTGLLGDALRDETYADTKEDREKKEREFLAGHNILSPKI